MKSGLKAAEPDPAETESTAAKVVPIAARPPLLLTPIAAARELGISRAQVYRMVRNGELASVMVGARIRIPYAAEEKIAAGKTAPEQQSV